MKSLEEISNAQSIGIAKGEALGFSVAAFEAVTGIEVPSFREDKLKATSLGRTFWKLRGKDIPGFVVSKWLDVGIAGTDSCVEYAGQSLVYYQRVGAPMCRFALLAAARAEPEITGLLNADSRYAAGGLAVPTPYPKLLSRVASWRDLPLFPLSEPPISGSAEAAAEMSGVGCVAEIVQTGNTARQNNLVEVLQLCNIYPELVQRSQP